MNLDNLKKLFSFSWAQAFSDQNGKSSVVPIAGLYLVVVSGIGFLKGIVMREADTTIQAVAMAGIGAGLLGYHKKIDGSPQDLGKITTIENSEPQP